MEQHDQPMKKRRCAVLLILVVGFIALVAAMPFGWCYFMERQRVADAEKVFSPLEPLGCRVFSNPCGLRYCSYYLEFRPGTKLSDDTISELISLNRLPAQNDLTVVIDTIGVTDKSVPHLKTLHTVDALDVTRTHISNRGIEELRQAMPGCDVIRRSR